LPDPAKYPLFQLFDPTCKKIEFVGRKLMNEYLYLSDEYRDIDSIYKILMYYINATNRNVIYEIGEFDGILGFTDITPGWKASLTFKLWNPHRWGADFLRQAKGFIPEVFDELRLARLETSTPDARIHKMALIVGFEDEGIRKANFMWNGKLFDDYMLAIVREDKDG